MATDWGRFVNNANAQAPTPATSTGPANVTELTFHLLNRGYFPFEEINLRVPITRDMLDVKCMQAKEFMQQWKNDGKAGTPMQGSALYVIQKTAALKRVAIHAPLILRISTQKEAMDAWIALVGTNGPKLYDVAMLVCWYGAPLEDMLKLNGASGGIMLNNMKTSAVHAPLKCCRNCRRHDAQHQLSYKQRTFVARYAHPSPRPAQFKRRTSANVNIALKRQDVPSFPAGSRNPYRPASKRHDEDGMQRCWSMAAIHMTFQAVILMMCMLYAAPWP
ncbi:hypothetical protein V8C86DRAFT_2445311 [Haematococcus lacustris]